MESGVLVIRNILLLKPAKLYEENPPKLSLPINISWRVFWSVHCLP